MPTTVDKKGQSQRILLSAVNFISQHGYANVSLRDIAQDAGVVLSQLNYYFKNKEGLFVEVVKTVMKKYLVEIEELLQRGSTAKERVNNLISYFSSTLKDNPKTFRLLFDLSNMAMWSTTFRDLLNSLFDDLARLIEKHVLPLCDKDSRLQSYSPNAIARMLFGAMFGVSIQTLLNNEEEQLPEAMAAIGAIL